MVRRHAEGQHRRERRKAPQQERQRKLRLCRMLFAGKMTLADVQRFEPMFDCGALVPPRFLPQWVSRANGLAGMLAFSLFANRIRLDNVIATEGLFELE